MPELEINLDSNTPEPIKKKELNAQEFIKKPKKIEVPAGTSSEEVLDFFISTKKEEIMPWETFYLPSKGFFYDGKIPEGKVQLRPMGLHTEKILATSRLVQSGRAIDEIFKQCIKFPCEFDPMDLLVGDRTFLLFVLRGISYGNMYEFMVKCTNTNCGKSSIHKYDLNEIGSSIKEPKSEKEPVKLILPDVTSLVGREMYVEMRYLRGRDSNIINSRRKVIDKAVGNNVRKANQDEPESDLMLDQAIEENMHLLVHSFNGVTDKMKINAALERLKTGDTSVILDWILNAAPGIDSEIVVTCPSCKNEMRMDLPFSDGFFRAKNDRRM